jgi:hypothetical protein
MTVPVYLPYYVLAGSVAIVAAILLGIRRALIMADWSNRDRRRAAGISAVVLIGWFGAAIALGWLGVYRGASDRIPTIQYGILVPILIGGLLILRSSTVARVLDAVPQHWLIGVQFYRALGIIFLILYGAGKLPGLFAWPAGLGDVLVGVLAPVVAIAYARGPRENGDLVSAWNIFGIADLIVAVATGLTTSPSPFQLFAFDLPNELISAFPLVLVPTYLVPVSVLLHLASLAKLQRTVHERTPQRPNLAQQGVRA